MYREWSKNYYKNRRAYISRVRENVVFNEFLYLQRDRCRFSAINFHLQYIFLRYTHICIYP